MTRIWGLYTLDLMRSIFLLLLLFTVCAGCAAQATPTPAAKQQYPATWTPAPTPRSTSRAPTPTLVIQGTSAPPPTRDPNARVLPSVRRNGIGIWLDLTSKTPKISNSLLAGANVVVTDSGANFQRSRNIFAFLSASSQALREPNSLPPEYNGVIVTSTNPIELEAIRRGIQPRLLLVSQSITETNVLTPSVSLVDGMQLENFLTEPNAPLSNFPTEPEWKRQVDVLAQWSHDPNAVVLVSTRTRASTGGNSEPVEQWLRFAFASFLIAANNSHTFFNFENAGAAQALVLPADFDLGTVQSAILKQNGVYQRRFTRGLILVNPGDGVRTLVLSRGYTDLSGNLLDRVQLQPHTGMILRNAK